ncbi:DUF6021 family protein [Pseudomonas sp. 3A(2025)]
MSDPESDDLNFDPESPDVEDPQVDPLSPAKTPEKDAPKGDYPPYNEPDDE